LNRDGAGGPVPLRPAISAKIRHYPTMEAPMKIAFLADPLAGFKTYKDSTYAMMVEAASRGHELYAFEQRDMALDSGKVTPTSPRHLTGDASTGTAPTAAGNRLHEFDAIVQRKDPPFDMEYVYGTYLLEMAEAGRARLQQAVGDPRPQRKADHRPVQRSSPRRPW
jgi:hypothetical protein